MTGGGKGKGKNLAAGVLLPYKLKVGKEISLYDEKRNRKNQTVGVALSFAFRLRLSRACTTVRQHPSIANKMS